MIFFTLFLPFNHYEMRQLVGKQFHPDLTHTRSYKLEILTLETRQILLSKQCKIGTDQSARLVLLTWILFLCICKNKVFS